MFQRFRANGPALFVPLAWVVVGAAHVGFVSLQALTIAHAVMAIMLAGFVVLSRDDMRAGALRTWWIIVAIGFVITTTGLVGLLSTPLNRGLLHIAIGGWMLLPAIGFIDTGRRSNAALLTTFGAAVISIAGMVVYFISGSGNEMAVMIAGLVLVGVGQTIGIVDAVIRY
ncbi:hypothetical protein [Haloquadratum walsbyi]|jgi:hypothetical protein|uniref:Uncharacterized protein n=1 Tax=Haloquadratum walsbyi J07HQW2 TaxID=1238425 RepID=U1NDL7_9EURY|nr:hypothetical protein [Haloquadratum walsbyi]ERG95085.1 MAG: hypothetical protein J07HQW2_01530 [Haloquadratum walsbyi J07HQW2]